MDDLTPEERRSLPQDHEILALITSNQGCMDPRVLIETLCRDHETKNVIEALQQGIERGKITLNEEGMVIALKDLLEHRKAPQ